MELILLGVLWLAVPGCVCGPVVPRGKDERTGGDSLTYLGDIADMKDIRRGGRVVHLLQEEEEAATSQIPSSRLLEFMKQFGYLAEGAPNTEALHTEEAITEAVKQIQIFGSLEPSGVLNQDTVQLLSKPRCGNKDEVISTSNAYRRRSKRFIVGSKGWKKRKITYNLSNWTPKLGSKEYVASELDRAFKSWAAYSNLEFVSIEDYHKADIRVAFGRYSHGDYYPFDGPGLILAHAYYPYEFGDLGGDIHFDEDEDWRVNVTETWSGMDFFTVAQHEIGHSLGLSHSPVSDSVMYPYYKGKQSNQGVGYDDVLAMYELYIKNPPEQDMETAVGDRSEGDYDIGSESPDTDDDNQTDYAADEGEYYDERAGDEEGPRTSTTSTSSTNSRTTTYYTTTRPVTETTDTDDSTTTHEGDHEDVEDICSTGAFDSIGHIRSELFVFLGKTMWRFSGRGSLRPGYPAPAAQMFGFPSSVQRIDAVYERSDGNILFFSGDLFWISDGNYFIDGSPRPLSDLGLPHNLTSIDAIFIWGKNKKTYIFAGNQYWRYDEGSGEIEAGYPRDMRNWRGVPLHIDGAITWRDGITYFFKAGKYWRFNDYLVITDSEVPADTSHHWFHC